LWGVAVVMQRNGSEIQKNLSLFPATFFVFGALLREQRKRRRRTFSPMKRYAILFGLKVLALQLGRSSVGNYFGGDES
jgi:hypothetical protein